MKKHLVIFLLLVTSLLILSSASFGQLPIWLPQNSGTTVFLESVYFVDSYDANY